MKLESQSSRWKDIPSYVGLYEVSDTGIVRSFGRSGTPGKELKQSVNKGYKQVWLSYKNKVQRLAVHRAVLMAFDRLPNTGEVCNHKDGNRFNNNLSNLEWCSREENEKHKRDVLGQDGKGERNGNFGNRRAKLYPSAILRNRLCELGVPRYKHNLAELGEMIPKNVAKPGCNTPDGKWVHATNLIGSNTEADARAKMLILLLENGLLTPPTYTKHETN